MDISNIFLLYDDDGSPESLFLVPVVGFAEAVGPVVGFAEAVGPVVGFVGASVTVVMLVKTVVFAEPPSKQLQMRNNNIIKDEVVQKLNKPDSNYADVMAIVTQQPCTIVKFHSSQ